MKKLNAYDFDDTILRGDSTRLFLLHCYRRPRSWRFLPKAAFTAVRYALGAVPFERLKEALFAVLQVSGGEDVKQFWDSRMDRIKPFYLSRMRDDDVIVTASPEFLVREAVKRLGGMRVIGTRMDPRTGSISGKNCKREEKTVRFAQEFGSLEIDAFYSDSLSDTPMALLAKEAYLIKGDTIKRWPQRRQSCPKGA